MKHELEFTRISTVTLGKIEVVIQYILYCIVLYCIVRELPNRCQVRSTTRHTIDIPLPTYLYSTIEYYSHTRSKLFIEYSTVTVQCTRSRRIGKFLRVRVGEPMTGNGEK